MAEGIARNIISEKYPESGITVSSAGLNTWGGSPASQHSIDACREIGIDLLGHRSRRINQEIADNTDLFAVMTPAHAQFLRQCGIPSGKIAVLGSGVPDPFGGDLEQYRACRDSLMKAVESLLTELAARNGETKDE